MNINVSLTDTDLKCLNNDLLDTNDWVEKAVQGKVSNCKKRMIKEWLPVLMDDPEIANLPANENDLVNLIVSHKNYKNRAAREVVS